EPVPMAGALGPTVGTANASGESLNVAQTSNLVDGQTVSLSVTTTAVTDDTAFVAVTQCGNATSAGVGIASLDPLGNDCASTEAGALGVYVKLIGSGSVPPSTIIGAPAGPVPAGR